MFCAGIVNGQKSPIFSMKKAIFDDFGDLKGIIGGKRGKEFAIIEKPSYKSLQSGKHLL